MKALTWLKYNFSAELRRRMASPGDDISTEQYPPTGDIVYFTYRSNGTTTLQVLADRPFPIQSALVGITNRDGERAYTAEYSSEGDFWEIYHAEAIYDFNGKFAYWLHKARRMS